LLGYMTHMIAYPPCC